MPRSVLWIGSWPPRQLCAPKLGVSQNRQRRFGSAIRGQRLKAEPHNSHDTGFLRVLRELGRQRLVRTERFFEALECEEAWTLLIAFDGALAIAKQIDDRFRRMEYERRRQTDDPLWHELGGLREGMIGAELRVRVHRC
jgi:hypothetical protein